MLLSVGVKSPGVPAELQDLVVTVATDEAQGYDQGHHYLVRPDGYLMLSTRGDDPAAVFARLQRLDASAPR